MTKEATPSPRPDVSRFAAGVGLLYAVLGMVWILASDTFIVSISHDPAWLANAQRYKGLFYVVVTSVSLIFLVRAGYRRILAALHRADVMELHARDLFVDHPKPMWVYDQETLGFLAVNEAATRYYGYPREVFLQMKLGDLCPPQELTAGATPLPGGVVGAQDLGVVRHRKHSGDIVFVHLSLHAVQFSRREAAMVMAMDVTADVLSKHALQRQEAQFRQLHQSLSDVLWIATDDGQNVLYVSPAIETIYGLSPAQMMADPDLWQQAVHPDDAALARASQVTLAATGEASCEYRILTACGDIKWVLDRKRLILDHEGLVTLMGGILEDITAAKGHEAERAQNQLELERLVVQRTAELVRVNGELEAFSRTVAHDLRGPLLTIVGFTQILQKRYGGVLGVDGEKVTARIERSAKQMAGLVNDLLSLSRVSTTALKIEEVDLAGMAREIMDEFRDQEPARLLRFEAPASLVVRGDAGLLRPLLVNLLGNAWKFTGKREQALVQILVETRGADRVLCIRDNGDGFDASQTELLFKPFQRFHSLSEFSGTGIGLTTCQRIIERHQGRIWVESTPGQGTAVFMTLAPVPAG